MSLLASLATEYKDEWLKLAHEWRDASEGWSSRHRDLFEREYWDVLESDARNLTEHINLLGDVMAQVARITDC